MDGGRPAAAAGARIRFGHRVVLSHRRRPLRGGILPGSPDLRGLAAYTFATDLRRGGHGLVLHSPRPFCTPPEDALDLSCMWVQPSPKHLRSVPRVRCAPGRTGEVTWTREPDSRGAAGSRAARRSPFTIRPTSLSPFRTGGQPAPPALPATPRQGVVRLVEPLGPFDRAQHQAGGELQLRVGFAQGRQAGSCAAPDRRT